MHASVFDRVQVAQAAPSTLDWAARVDAQPWADLGVALDERG